MPAGEVAVPVMYAQGFDGEIGAMASVSFPVAGDWLRLGAEVQGGVDQHGSPRFYASGSSGRTFC